MAKAQVSLSEKKLRDQLKTVVDNTPVSIGKQESLPMAVALSRSQHKSFLALSGIESGVYTKCVLCTEVQLFMAAGVIS